MLVAALCVVVDGDVAVDGVAVVELTVLVLGVIVELWVVELGVVV